MYMSRKKNRHLEVSSRKKEQVNDFTLFPYLATTFIEVNEDPEKQKYLKREDNFHLITISCHTLAAQVSLLSTYLSTGLDRDYYRSLPRELMPYKNYFIMKDVIKILNSFSTWTTQGDYSLFLNKSNEGTIRNLYEFSKRYPVYLQIGNGEDKAPSHHFCLYREKIFSSWGDKFYVGYVEADTNVDEFVFYALYDFETASEEDKLRFREITKKYIFRMEEFNVFSTNVKNKMFPDIYREVVDALVTHEDEDDETKLPTLLSLFGISEDEYTTIVYELMEEDIDLDDANIPQKVIAAVIYKNRETPDVQKYITDDLKHLIVDVCWFDYEEGVEEQVYTKDFFDTRKKVIDTRETFIKSTPLKQSLRSSALNHFNNYYQEELERILKDNVRCLFYNLSETNTVNRWKTHYTTKYEYNETAWDSMESFIEPLIRSNGYDMFPEGQIPYTLYGHNYSKLLDISRTGTEYNRLQNLGFSTEYIQSVLERGYAAIELAVPTLEETSPRYLVVGTAEETAQQCPISEPEKIGGSKTKKRSKYGKNYGKKTKKYRNKLTKRTNKRTKKRLHK